nr:NAD(P)-dependent oxidoreductase [Nitrososphaera sp.]
MLLTGSSGFIGSRIKKAFQEHGDEVFSVTRGESAKGDVQSDVSDPRIVEKVSFPIDLIIHAAAYTDTRPSAANNYEQFFATNCLGTLNMLKVAQRRGADLIYISTCDVYGKPKSLPINETHPPNPITVYAATKSAAEQLCHGMSQANNFRLRIARPFNTYGPNSPKYRVISSIITQLVSSDSVTINNIQSKRDFVFVDDVASAIVKLSEFQGDDVIVNIGTGITHSIAEVFEVAKRVTGKDTATLHAQEESSGPIPVLQADITRIKKLGWRPKFDLERGLLETAREMRLN